MDRISEFLKFPESCDQSFQLMDQSLITVEKNCHSLRDYIKEQQKFMISSSVIGDDEKKKKEIEMTTKFYDHIKHELVILEEMCHEYRVKIRANLVSEFDQRLQPPWNTSLETFKKSFDLCSNVLIGIEGKEQQPIIKKCLCNWTNIDPLLLTSTKDIVYGPKILMPSEFDESDQKFKQEIMMLRTKIFYVSNKHNGDIRGEEEISDKRQPSGRASIREFIENVTKTDMFTLPPLNAELAKVNNLKFVEGKFNLCDPWMRLLETYGQQLRSKWYLVVCPQIESLLKKYRVTMIHFSAREVFYFILKIPENGFNYIVTRKDLIPLVKDNTQIAWLKGWKMQLRAIDGKSVAAILIQSYWRRYKVRKSIFEKECRYIAASVLWVAWIVVKKKRQMHERYLRNMLTSLSTTRNLGFKLSNEYDLIIETDHVVIHLPSVGFPIDVRRTFGSNDLAIYQNTMCLKLSSIRNPRAQVIYVMPVKLTDNLLKMYNDLIESVLPNENAQKRVSFLELSQADTFADRSFNVTRTLHCSEDTLVDIRNRIANKPVFCIPWIMDECDVRLAGNLGVPLLAPDLEMQQRMINKSLMAEMISDMGLQQPPYAANIKDYTSLCSRLAEQICLNTEVCLWLFKLNFGLSNRHVGVFLVNSNSIPFMPILRKERENHGDEWRTKPEVRLYFLKRLYSHLPSVVSRVTKFTCFYEDWRSFYSHIIKYGCLLQAVPNEKSSSSVSVSIFIPALASGKPPKWTGTADKVYLAPDSRFSTFAHMMPQSSLDNAHIEPVVEKLTKGLQNTGYFGYLYVDLFCFPDDQQDEIIILIVETNPYYGHAQHFIDWMKLAINGSYDRSANTFYTRTEFNPENERSNFSTIIYTGKPSRNKVTQRHGIAISHLYHTEFSSYKRKDLIGLIKDCGIEWNSVTKQGAHFILHDGVSRNSAMLIAIAPSMKLTVALIKMCLKKLYNQLILKINREAGSDDNLIAAITYFSNLSRNYKKVSNEKLNHSVR